MARFLNRYHCYYCDESWEDEWSCGCDDECPSCGRDFTPVESLDLEAPIGNDRDDPANWAPCALCRKSFHLDDLDAKPRHRQFREMRADFGQLHALYIAGERGWDFDRLECQGCYGPGYVNVRGE